MVADLASSVSRFAHVVDKSLRKCFPEDYDRRCMYAAFGMHVLARKVGLDAIIVAGDFMALCVAKDNSKASYQGYQKSDGEFAHYWCEIQGHTVDLGPKYLSVSSTFPVASLPVMMWRSTEKLPVSIRYRPRMRYHTDVQPMLAEPMMERLRTFLSVCDEKYSNLFGKPKTKDWLLSGKAELQSAALRGDPWALGAMRAENLPQQNLPF